MKRTRRSPRQIVVNLREVDVGDIAAIAALEHLSFHKSGEAFSRRQVRYLVTRAKAVALVAVEGGQVVGWVAVLRRRHGRRHSARVYTLAVRPEARGRGVGRALLERVLRTLPGEGVRRVFLEVAADNEPAIGLYRKLGFHATGQLADYYGRHRHALHMLRQTGLRNPHIGS